MSPKCSLTACQENETWNEKKVPMQRGQKKKKEKRKNRALRIYLSRRNKGFDGMTLHEVHLWVHSDESLSFEYFLFSEF